MTETEKLAPLVPEDGLTIAEVVGVLRGHVGEDAVRRWIDRPVRPLPSFRVGRLIFVSRAALAAWLEDENRAGDA